MNTLPTSGKELRILRLQGKVSRRRLASHMDRSEERVAQIERKRCVRPDAARRYRAGLEAAVKVRELVHGRGAK
jgi:transcriptional regulator with XRE-family HTH domain